MNAGAIRVHRRILSGILAFMFAAGAAQAQVGFRAAASGSAIAPEFRDSASAAGTNAVTFVGAGSQVSRESSGSLTPQIPNAAQANDFAVLIVAGRPTNTAEPAAPAGWTLRNSSLREVGSNDLKIMTFYRVLIGGDADPSITLPGSWVGSDTAGMSAQIAVWRGVNTAVPFDVADATGSSAANQTWTPPSLSTATDGALVVSAVATSDANDLDFDSSQGFALRMSGTSYDTSTGGDHAIGLADRTQTSAGAVTMARWEQDNSSPDSWAGITFVLRPMTTVTIALPGATAQNDVMIASIGVRPSTASITAPPGWTLVRRIDNASATSNSLIVYRRLAGSSEPGSYSWSSVDASFAVGGIQSFSGVDTATPIDVESTGQATASGTSHATASVTTTVNNTLIVTSHTFASSRSWTATGGMAEAFDQQSGADNANGQSIAGSFELQGIAGATGTKIATAAGDADAGNAHILALRPASSGLIISKPAGTVANDLMIASIAMRPHTAVVVPPPGWAFVRRVDNSGGNSNSLAIYRKLDSGAEPASYSWSITGFFHVVGGIQSFSGVDVANPVDAEDGQSTPSGTSHATPSVIRTINGTMMVTSHTFSSARTWSPPSGMTESIDAASHPPSDAVGQALETAWLSEYAMGATGAKTASVGGDADTGNAHILALRPATPPALPGRFNAFESSTGSGAVTGVIKTRIAGRTSNVDLVALTPDGSAIYTAFADAVRVELLDASDNSGTLDSNGCRSTWTVIQTVSPDPVFSTANNGRRTISFNQANSYQDVRLRITYPAGAPLRTGCSTDNFAIRPDQFRNLRARDSDWENPGTSRTLNERQANGTPFHKAGRPFTVTAEAENDNGSTTTNYSGTPTAVLSDCGGDSACLPTFGTFTLGASFVAGQLASNAATYSEVGSFHLQLVDSTFANVDAADSTANEREIRSSNVDVGRFVPDHFTVSYNTPAFAPACSAGGFTYVGQAFAYAVAPVMTVTARNFSGETTTNYAGSLWRMTSSSLSGKSYTAATETINTGGLPGTDPTVAASGNGIGTLTFGSGSGLFFNRSSPLAPFDAEISLAINVIDQDGVQYAANPARFGQASAGNGIAFNSGKSMRFGRLVLRAASGSQLVPLPVTIEAQYWGYTNPPVNSALGFITNTLDSCTSLANNNVAMSSFTGNLSACETAISGAGALSAGRRTLLLPPPGASNTGSVLLTANLGTSSSGTTCTTVGGGTVSAAGASRTYLRGAWSGSAYDDNPSARAAFGSFMGAEEVIFIRENF
jgi:MSHA biogenesis protein MshQ